MKKMKKLISFVLCFAMTGYAFPVLAAQSIDSVDTNEIIVISDTEMEQLVGAGTVDVKVSDYSAGEQATAVFVNRSTLSSTYSIVETNANGVVVGTILTGSLLGNTAVIVSGPVAFPAGGYVIRANISVAAFPAGITATDSFMH